jgi:hypothetical protein
MNEDDIPGVFIPANDQDQCVAWLHAHGITGLPAILSPRGIKINAADMLKEMLCELARKK